MIEYCLFQEPNDNMIGYFKKQKHTISKFNIGLKVLLS